MSPKTIALLLFSIGLLLIFAFELIAFVTPSWYIIKFDYNGTAFTSVWGFFFNCLYEDATGLQSCDVKGTEIGSAKAFWIAISAITLLLYGFGTIITLWKTYTSEDDVFKNVMKFFYGFTLPAFGLQIILAIWTGVTLSKLQNQVSSYSFLAYFGASFALHLVSLCFYVVLLVTVNIVQRRQTV